MWCAPGQSAILSVILFKGLYLLMIYLLETQVPNTITYFNILSVCFCSETSDIDSHLKTLFLFIAYYPYKYNWLYFVMQNSYLGNIMSLSITTASFQVWKSLLNWHLARTLKIFNLILVLDFKIRFYFPYQHATESNLSQRKSA